MGRWFVCLGGRQRVIFLTSVLLTPVSLLPAQIPSAWDQAYARFSEGYQKLDAGMVGRLYAEDAFYLQPDSEVIRGREKIHEIFDRFFASVRQRGDSIRITFDFVDRSVSGDLGYDIGHYTLTGYSKDRPPQASRGKFVVLWKRGRDGVWRIHTDGYSGVQ
ncbi:MAG: DUF4440 domain-containing protein [Gemmatimonadetes bacterium]|nr:DUF4440 domain-containing protein [Gemmatimonadota bacterium]